MINKKIFGTDGVRGKANHYPMTVEVALAIGRAAGYLFRQKREKPRVVIGKDTRLSCYLFENALIAGLCSMGVDTLMLGPYPTPGVAFITRVYRADAGIVISASHNNYCDNGIKFFSSDGYKLPDEWETEIEKLVATNNFDGKLPPDSCLGKNTRITDGDGRYIEFAKATFPRSLTLNGLKIALDCANGAGYRTAPLILQELGAEVSMIGCTPDGLNINHQCGSVNPKSLQQLVREDECHIGIALDGDGDRLILVDEKGELVDGDTILAICAKDMKRRGELRSNIVVGTVMSNLGFVETMKEEGIQVLPAKVGDRNVILEMLKYESNLGGEQSGHLIFHDHNTTGDGIVAALQVLRIMVDQQKSLSELASFVKKYPQIRIDVPVTAKPPVESIDSLKQKMEEAEKKLGAEGRVLVRYSGTEPLCRVMVEDKDKERMKKMAEGIAQVVKEEIGVE